MTYRLTLAAMLLVTLAATGCVSQAQYDDLSKQNLLLRDQVKKAQQQTQDLQQKLDLQQKQVQSLLQLGPKRLDLIPAVTGVELGPYTGGFNTDVTKKGDDAVKVYLLPTDADGSIVKAPGSVTIQLFDLTAPGGPVKLGESTFTPQEVRKHWFSGFLSTYHYSFVCPWTQMPHGSEITVRVEFIDYWTAQHFVQQKVIKVTNPRVEPLPASQPATPR